MAPPGSYRWLASAAPYALLSLAFLAVTLPLVAKPYIDVYDSYDEQNTHLPLIRHFLDSYPRLNLTDYDAPAHPAMTPLYHVTMAVAAMAIGFDPVRLRLANLLLSLLCLLVVYHYLARKGSAKMALFASLCFMLSPYFLGPSVRLATDNGALLALLLSMMVLDRKGPPSAREVALSAVLSTGAVLTRQIHVWIVGVALYKVLPAPDSAVLQRAISGAVALVPVAALVPFLMAWGGLTPPAVQQAHGSPLLNPDVAVFAVSLIGLYGSFFAPWFIGYLRDALRNPWPVILMILLSATALVVHPVSYSHEQGRWGGGLWTISLYLPEILSTSVAFWALFPLGTVLCYAAAIGRRREGDQFMLVCAALWLIANMASQRVFQKYYEPFAIFLIGYFVVQARPLCRRCLLAPAALISLLAAIDLFRFFL